MIFYIPCLQMILLFREKIISTGFSKIRVVVFKLFGMLTRRSINLTSAVGIECFTVAVLKKKTTTVYQ